METDVQRWLTDTRRTTQGPPHEQHEYADYVNGIAGVPDRRRALAEALQRRGLNEVEWFRIQRNLADATVNRERTEYGDLEADVINWYENDRRRQLGLTHDSGRPDIEEILPENFGNIMRRRQTTEADWFRLVRGMADDRVQREIAEARADPGEDTPILQEGPDADEKHEGEEKHETAQTSVHDSDSEEEFVDPEEGSEEELTAVGGRPAHVQLDLQGDPADEFKPDDPPPEQYNTDMWRGPKRASGGQRGGYPLSRTEDDTHFLYWVWWSPSHTQRQDGKGVWKFKKRTRKPAVAP